MSDVPPITNDDVSIDVYPVDITYCRASDVAELYNAYRNGGKFILPKQNMNEFRGPLMGDHRKISIDPHNSNFIVLRSDQLAICASDAMAYSYIDRDVLHRNLRIELEKFYDNPGQESTQKRIWLLLIQFKKLEIKLSAYKLPTDDDLDKASSKVMQFMTKLIEFINSGHAPNSQFCKPAKIEPFSPDDLVKLIKVYTNLTHPIRDLRNCLEYFRESYSALAIDGRMPPSATEKILEVAKKIVESYPITTTKLKQAISDEISPVESIIRNNALYTRIPIVLFFGKKLKVINGSDLHLTVLDPSLKMIDGIITTSEGNKILKDHFSQFGIEIHVDDGLFSLGYMYTISPEVTDIVIPPENHDSDLE